MTNAVSDLLHAQCRLSLLQWNAGGARLRPTQLVTATCGSSNAVLLHDVHDHVPYTSDQFDTYTDDGGLAILFEHVPALRCEVPDHREQDHAEPHSTGCPWSPAKTPCWRARDALGLFGPPAQRRCQEARRSHFLHAHTVRLDVDFVGGDVNMAVNGPVAAVFNKR